MMSEEMVATLVAPAGTALNSVHVEAFAQTVQQAGGQEVNIVRNVDNRAADVFFKGPAPETNSYPFDVIVQGVANRRKKILVADMESTIIEQEMLDELAKEVGMGDQVAKITQRAMNGELDFAAAVNERVALLKGQPMSILERVGVKMTLMPGAKELVLTMSRNGANCWLVTGGFRTFAKMIGDRIGFHQVYSNELIVENGIITGKVREPMVDKNSKKKFLEMACHLNGVDVSEALAVGDGANDIPMLKACQDGEGLGVAFKAKPAVRDVIQNQINQSDLIALLFAQGLVPISI